MDVFIAVMNIAICVFAFSKGAGYIKNKDNQMDWWWQTNAAMVAIAAVGIVINMYVISKTFRPKGGYDYAGPVVPLPPQFAAPAPGVSLQSAEATNLLKKSQALSEAAKIIGQLNHA